MRLLAVTAVTAPFVLISPPVSATAPPTLFELDGNGFVDAGSPPDVDWSCYVGTLKADGTPGTDPNCASAPAPLSSSGLLTDAYNVNTDDQFTQVKDYDRIAGCANPNDCWQWKLGGANPDKNDLEHAAVLSFQDGTQTIAYFMADRFKVQGSAFLGFWFFRSPVAPNPIPAGSTVGTFSGAHVSKTATTRGDVLVLANFVQGSGGSADQVTTAVYEWDTSCVNTNNPDAGCAEKNLRILQPQGESSCLTSNGPVCAIFNQTAGVPSPWPFDPATNSAPANKWEFTSFTEGGIDLTEVLGGDDCVTSFVVETRTSASTDADLTDFIAGDINTCGRIKIVKDAVPNDAQDFSFSATKPATETKVPASFQLDDDADATLSNTADFDNIRPGTYTFTEQAVAGWALTSVVCTSDKRVLSNYQTGATVSLTVQRGEAITCTYTNTKAPKLKLVKSVTNDNGGTSVPNDWDLTAAGNGGFSETSPSVATATFREVVAGVSYALSETGPSGYAAGSWSCSGGTQSGSNVTLAAGQEATCTITNDDIAPKLHLRKIVVNDNGGTNTIADFTLTADGTGANDISGTSPVDSGSGLKADTWALSESTVAGYTGSAWSCVGGTQNGSSITVGIGGEATCTVTNDDDAAHLIVIKHVVNDNGGVGTASNFTMTINGVTATGGNSFVGSESPGTDKVLTSVGAYSVTEGAVAGYTQTNTSADCVGTIALGQTKTCTITNDDIAPKLHLRKIVVNDNGGTATAADFTLTADGTDANDISGTSPVDSGATLQADTWALSESGPNGYTASAWVCVGGTQNGSNITVGIGGEATCTITNDDIAPKLHLRKIVVNDNGGTKTIANFTLTADGTGANDISGTSPVDSGSGLKADTWALSETNVYGYTASAWSCVGGTQNGSSITVGIGGEATCTITNDDKPGTIVVKKVTKPADPNTLFAFEASGTWYSGFNLSDQGSNTQILNAGSYTVKELVPLGWVLTGIGGSTDPNTPYACTVTGSGGSTGLGDLNTQTASISLKNGDTVTCVFENTGQGVTRTQGFWATHTPLANIAWFGGTAFGHTFPGVADKLICAKNVDDLGKLMGGFWSDIAKTSSGGKRTALDQARMQLLQQLLAAELNGSAFGSVPSVGSFAAWEAAYCSTNTNAIKTAQAQAAAFNNSGDTAQFTPGTSADAKNARAIANYAFWNNTIS